MRSAGSGARARAVPRADDALGRRSPGAAAQGPHEPVSRAEIARAVPSGSRRARGQHEFLERLGADPDLAGLRADRARNIAECGRVWARFASWRDRTTRPTRTLMRKLTGLSVTTVKSARRWLEQHGYLGLVRQGRASWLRPGILTDSDAPNEAQILVLCVPRRKHLQSPVRLSDQVTRPLTPSRRDGVLPPAREDEQTDPKSPLGIVRYMRRQVAELSRGPGQTLSEGYVMSVSRPWLAAGYSPSDLAWAINHDPGRGRHRKRLATVREPAHWLAWRLSRWCTRPDDAYAKYRRFGHWDFTDWPVPVAPPSAVRAAAHQRDLEDQAALRAAFDTAGRTDPAPYAAAIRARLGWKTRQA